MFIPWFKLKLTALLKKIEPKARTLFEFGLPTAKKTLGGKAGRRPGTHLKSRPSKIILVPLLVLLLIFSTGCWDKREIEDLAFLTAWGLDRLENDEIQASVVIVKPFAVAGPAGGGAVARERPFWLAKSTGRTLLEAMCNFATFSPRFIFCAHSRFVIFGEETAREGIEEMLDFFERNREPRLTAHIFIAKGMTAAKFLESEYELVPLPPEGGQGMLQNATDRLGTTVDTNINDFLIMLEEDGIEPVVGCWEVISKKPVPLKGELLREEIIQSPVVNGAAAFKDDRLVGWLSPEEARGLQWILGGVKSTPLIVKNPVDPPRLLGIEVMRATSELIPSIKKGKPHIKIKVEFEGSIDDNQGFFDPEKNPNLIGKIENYMADAVEREIRLVLHRCQQDLNTDVFGFGAAINRAYPREWKRLKKRWDEEFPRVDVSVDIEAHIRLSGLIIKSIKKEN